MRMNTARSVFPVLDTLRLTIPAESFAPADVIWMQRQMHKLTKTDFTGCSTDWSICTGLDLPSWADSFSLTVGSRITVEASPKIYQGHNIDGPQTLREAAHRIVDFVFGSVLRLASWPSASRWYVARLDVTYSYDFVTRAALESWFDTVAGIQRGQRRASVDVRANDDPLAVHAAPSGRTLYQGLGSRLKVGKIYCKGADLRAHPPRCLSADKDFLDGLVEEFQPIARFECQLRASWLSLQACRLGLLPAHMSTDLMGLLLENAFPYLESRGMVPLKSRNAKKPIVYFTVAYLADYLDLNAVWDSEFSHLFAREVAMNDDTLIKELLSIAPKPGQALAAFDFYARIRALGFSGARASVSKSAFYRYRRLLGSAGVSDAMLQDGAPLIRSAPSVVNVRAFTPRRERLDLVEQVHAHYLPANIDRLHAEVFRRSA